VVAHGIVSDGEFEYPVEDHPSAVRATAVEAEHELVQLASKMCAGHRPLVGAQKPPFGQRSNPVHARQHVTRILAPGRGGALDPPFVDLTELIQAPVSLPAVGNDCRVRLDAGGDEGMQRRRRRIGQRHHPTAAEPLRTEDLHRNARQHLLPGGRAPGKSLSLAADIGLVDLHLPTKPSSAERTAATVLGSPFTKEVIRSGSKFMAYTFRTRCRKRRYSSSWSAIAWSSTGGRRSGTSRVICSSSPACQAAPPKTAPSICFAISSNLRSRPVKNAEKCSAVALMNASSSGPAALVRDR